MAVVGGFLAFVVTVVFMFALRPVATEMGLVDKPGGRKRHGADVPLIGGVAMSIGLGFGTSLISQPEFWHPTILGIYLLVAVGTIDDRFDLTANIRLIAQTCAALLVVFGSELMVTRLGAPFGFGLALGVLAAPFTILFVLTVINAFNVIDGIDGLAGGLAFLCLLALAVIGFEADTFVLTALLLAVVGGFLVFNLPLTMNRPVRAFMGDAGSTALGLAIACIGIALSQGAGARMSPVIGLWLIAVPVFDLFSAIVRRLVERKSPFAPDHEHLHHVLVEHGLSHRTVLAFVLTLGAAFAGFGLAGHLSGASDASMLMLWIGAGTFYYQLMRHPAWVVRLLARRALESA